MNQARSLNPLPNYSWGTLVLTAVCLSLAATGLLLFWIDLTSSVDDDEGTSLARVKVIRAGVRRKPATSLLWNPARPGQALFRHDVVHAGPDGAATLGMRNGSELELSENSLVVIDDSADLSLRFIQGDFIVHGPREDVHVSVDREGHTHIQKLPIRVTRPEPMALFHAPRQGTAPVDFVWEQPAAQSTTALQLELARDRRFTSVQHFALSGASQRISLSPGRYFWRIISGSSGSSASGADKAQTPPRELRVLAIPRPVGISPNTTTALSTWGERAQVFFRWLTPPEESESGETWDTLPCTLEISPSPDFKTLTLTRSVSWTSGAAKIADVPRGHYYWRLRVGTEGAVEYSPPLELSLDARPKLPLRQVSPESNGLVRRESAHFSWQLDGEADDFVWELAREGSGQEPILSLRGPAQILDVALPSAGTYRWRVVAHAADATVGESPWRPLAVGEGSPLVLNEPADHSEIFYWKDRAPVRLAWQSERAIASYQVELSPSAAFNDTHLLDPTRQPLVEIPAPVDGAYFWRVRGLDDKGRAVRFSEPRSFVYGLHPLLAAPGTATPEPQFVFKKVSRESVPTLTWASVPLARRYEVTVRSGDKIAFHREIADNQVTLSGIGFGKYEWSVRAIDPLDRPGQPLPWRALTVDYRDALAAPKIVDSEVH